MPGIAEMKYRASYWIVVEAASCVALTTLPHTVRRLFARR
jgi:hypothetical protein